MQLYPKKRNAFIHSSKLEYYKKRFIRPNALLESSWARKYFVKFKEFANLYGILNSSSYFLDTVFIFARDIELEIKYLK